MIRLPFLDDVQVALPLVGFRPVKALLGLPYPVVLIPHPEVTAGDRQKR
jgi:hypothetical protein